MRNRFLLVSVFLCTIHNSLHSVDAWNIGLALMPPFLNMFLNIFVQKFFPNEQKTEKDRVNESLAVHIAILNSPDASHELKKNAQAAIMRAQEESECLDIRDYLKSSNLKNEDKDLVIWAEKKLQESGKKILQISQNSV